MQSQFICPKCQKPLSIAGGAYKCHEGHSYDISKQGYVNLLPPSSKGVHGDNKEMIKARRAFLDQGYYKPLADALVNAIGSYWSRQEGALLDAGCGEGYYTQYLEVLPGLCCCGIDISKDALILASKRLKNTSLAVANVYHMPFDASSFDIITNVFAPFDRSEYHRVLKENGRIYIVIPDENHLFELKAAIYDTPYKNQLSPFELEGFELLSESRLSYSIDLKSSSDLQALFKMTPYYYRTSVQNRARLDSLNRLETTAEFVILEYLKK